MDSIPHLDPASPFRSFERVVVKMLTSEQIPQGQIEALLDTARLVSLEHTGVGYFLTVAHEKIPTQRVVCDLPAVMGKTGDIACGFIVFLEGGELTLECHSWGDGAIPADIRDRRVEVTPMA